MDSGDELKQFGQQVRYWRQKRGLSQQALADKVGYKGKDMISRIESGQTNIPMPKAVEISEALNCKLSDLLRERPEGIDMQIEMVNRAKEIFEGLTESDMIKMKEYSDLLRRANNGDGKMGR